MDSHDLVRLLLAAALTWAAVLNAWGPEFVRFEFKRWGYPTWLRYGVALAELAAAMLLINAAFKWGAWLSLGVLGGVLASLAKDRAWLRMEYPAMLAALAIVILNGK